MNTPNLPLKYIIIGRCEFSGWAEAIHVSNISGAIVAKFLYDHFITRFGLFHTLKSDGGPEFRNSILQSLLENYNINQIIGTPNYPQSHGYIERNHQCLINTLKKMPATQPWYHYLTHALWVDRTQIRSTTGLSAQYLVHGFHGHATLSQLYTEPIPSHTLSQQELFEFRFKQLQRRSANHISAEIMTSQQRQLQKYQFDKHRGTADPLKLHDLILLYDQPFTTIKSNKLKPLWSGPYRIASSTNQVYYLKDLAGQQLRIPYPRHRLKLYYPRDSYFSSPGDAVAHGSKEVPNDS